MNKDIQTLIEREAEEIASKSLYPDKITNITVYSKACVNNYFRAGANFALSLFKWRKVSEGLPEVKQEAYWIIAKDEDMHCETFYVNNDMLYDISFYLEDYTHWMPIPQID